MNLRAEGISMVSMVDCGRSSPCVEVVVSSCPSVHRKNAWANSVAPPLLNVIVMHPD